MRRSLLSVINSKFVFLIFTMSCFIAIGTCVIVDYALNRRITWAAYPILSVSAGWLIFAPTIYKKYIASLCIFSVVSIPFLFMLEKLTPVHGWFFALGLPVAIVGILSIWATFLLFRFTGFIMWYKIAISVFMHGVIVNLVISHIVDSFLVDETSLLENLISTFSCVFVSALFLIFGYMKKNA